MSIKCMLYIKGKFNYEYVISRIVQLIYNFLKLTLCRGKIIKLEDIAYHISSKNLL